MSKLYKVYQLPGDLELWLIFNHNIIDINNDNTFKFIENIKNKRLYQDVIERKVNIFCRSLYEKEDHLFSFINSISDSLSKQILDKSTFISFNTE